MAKKSKSVSYRQPRSVNVVSVGMLLLLCAAVYWGYCFGPAYLRYYQVRQLVHEGASRYYKLSSLEKHTRAQHATELMNETRKKIVDTLGFNDPQLTVQLLINEETKRVNVIAEYDQTIPLAFTEKVRVVHFKALGESDYLPNDW